MTDFQSDTTTDFNNEETRHDPERQPAIHDVKMSGFGFDSLGLNPKLLKALRQQGFDTPTPIQRDAIPHALEGTDVMGLAQTGTGKTAAFGLPLIHRLLEDGKKAESKSIRSLILAPTRELANQISEHMRAFTKHLPIHVMTIVGGASLQNQIRGLHRGTDILVATPGRLIDLMKRNAIRLDSAKFLVLDEADQMLDLGFIHSLRTIAKSLGQPRQTMLFSATMPKQIEELSRTYLNDPVRVQVSPPGKAADKIRQSVHFVHQRGKADHLKDLLVRHMEERAIVFARTKHGAEKLMLHLVSCGFKAASIHGNKSQGQRDRAIKAFKSGDIKVLVATDVAARGIDIPDVKFVYNYDLPEVAENYVHRIGRTARAGAEGEAVAFCGPHENKLLREIEKLMKIKLPVESGEKQADDMTDAPARGRPQGRGRQGQGRQGQARQGQARQGQGRDANGGGRSSQNGRGRAPYQGKPDDQHSEQPRGDRKPRTNSRPLKPVSLDEGGYKPEKSRNTRPGRFNKRADHAAENGAADTDARAKSDKPDFSKPRRNNRSDRDQSNDKGHRTFKKGGKRGDRKPWENKSTENRSTENRSGDTRADDNTTGESRFGKSGGKGRYTHGKPANGKGTANGKGKPGGKTNGKSTNNSGNNPGNKSGKKPNRFTDGRAKGANKGNGSGHGGRSRKPVAA